MKIIGFILFTSVSITIGWLAHTLYVRPTSIPNPINQVKPRPLDKYTFDNLSRVEILPSEIKIGETLKQEKEFTSYLFEFELDPTLRQGSGQVLKKVTGLVNIPSGDGPFPLIVMFRGYIDQKQYKTGDGTKRAGEYFARAGFITIAPDFLGYGGSDKEADNIFESRFQTYTTALVLIKSLSTIQQFNNEASFLWGHSNGGQIALTVLEITGATYPTVLWAPVSKPFPYSVLFYTDESEDRGKLIRRELASFEGTYDPDLYSLDFYLGRIKAPLSIHQGTLDDAVPREWTDELVKKLKNDGNLDIDYFVYSGADHNLNPSWNIVIARSLEFFKTSGERSRTIDKVLP